MRLKYHVSDIIKMADQDEEELELWLIDHPEFSSEDGFVYYETFNN